MVLLLDAEGVECGEVFGSVDELCALGDISSNNQGR